MSIAEFDMSDTHPISEPPINLLTLDVHRAIANVYSSQVFDSVELTNLSLRSVAG